MAAKHVMFVVLSVEDEVNFSVDMRIFNVPFTATVTISALSPSFIC